MTELTGEQDREVEFMAHLMHMASGLARDAGYADLAFARGCFAELCHILKEQGHHALRDQLIELANDVLIPDAWVRRG